MICRLKRAINVGASAKLSPEAQNEEVMKRWMNKFMNKGKNLNFFWIIFLFYFSPLLIRKGYQNDLEDVEEIFDENLKDQDGWVTDKVWSGKQIPHEFLEDNVNLKKMNMDWNNGYDSKKTKS